jgi:hypothetical protein
MVGIDGNYAGAGGFALGATLFPAAAAGEAVPTVVLGSAPVEASAAIALGAEVEVVANGRIATKSSGAVVGRALSAAGQEGDIVELLLLPR